MSLKELPVLIPMKAGVTGIKQFTIPPGYKFVSIVNGSINTLEVYQDTRQLAQSKPSEALQVVPLNTALTLPIGSRSDFTVIYNTGGGGEDQTAKLFFSETNLGINGTLGSNISSSVNIASDSAGLAKADQFPTSLSPNGFLAVEILEAIPQSHVIVDELPTLNTAAADAMTTTPSTAQLTLTASTAAPLRVGASDLANRKNLAVYNLDASNTVYVGGSAVTDTTGWPIPPGGYWSIDQNPSNSAPVYVYTTGTGVKVAVMEVS